MDDENGPSVFRASRVPGIADNERPRPCRPLDLISVYLSQVLEVVIKGNEEQELHLLRGTHHTYLVPEKGIGINGRRISLLWTSRFVHPGSRLIW